MRLIDFALILQSAATLRSEEYRQLFRLPPDEVSENHFWFIQSFFFFLLFHFQCVSYILIEAGLRKLSSSSLSVSLTHSLTHAHANIATYRVDYYSYAIGIHI